VCDYSLGFSPNGHWLASNAGYQVTIWDATLQAAGAK
jgi:hypothetical protein